MKDLTPCILREHERQHFAQTPKCRDCPIDADPERMSFGPNVSPGGGECEAFAAEVKCLDKNKKDCGNDNVCKKRVYQVMKDSQSTGRARCAAGIRDTDRYGAR